MNDMLKNFIESKINEETEKNQKEKNELLMSLNLYEKVYAPDDCHSEEYSYSEWDSATSKNKFYKPVPIDITDEEYKELLKHVSKKEDKTENSIAIALKVIAWTIFIVGAIAGFAFGNAKIPDTYDIYAGSAFSLTIAFTYWSIALVSGTIFLAFSEIINLLEKIKNK
ncbi:MAG: APC family permease [Clostridia bacterium]|nr:APC family permease [Clostridia bacterium]